MGRALKKNSTQETKAAELALFKQLLDTNNVGTFLWHTDTSVTFDITSQGMMGLPLRGNGKGGVFTYSEWAECVVDAEELSRTQDSISRSLTASKRHIDIILYRNGRSILHLGRPNIDGYKMVGVSIDVTDCKEAFARLLHIKDGHSANADAQLADELAGERLRSQTVREERDRLRSLLSAASQSLSSDIMSNWETEIRNG